MKNIPTFEQFVNEYKTWFPRIFRISEYTIFLDFHTTNFDKNFIQPTLIMLTSAGNASKWSQWLHTYYW